MRTFWCARFFKQLNFLIVLIKVCECYQIFQTIQLFFFKLIFLIGLMGWRALLLKQ